MDKLPIEMILDQVQWAAVPEDFQIQDGLPYVTHEGILNIAGLKLNVLQLSNGHRVIPEAEMQKFFEWLGTK